MKQGLDNRSMNMAQGANGTSAQDDPMKPQGLSRRNFVAAAAMGLAGVAAAGLAGCSPKSSGRAFFVLFGWRGCRTFFLGRRI